MGSSKSMGHESNHHVSFRALTFISLLAVLSAVVAFFVFSWTGLKSQDGRSVKSELVDDKEKPSILLSKPLDIEKDYKTAYDESFGFFDDISETDWEIMRGITLNRDPWSERIERYEPNKWYQLNGDPDFSCRFDTRLGTGDGAKWICDPLRIKKQSALRMQQFEREGRNVTAGCLIYSVGSHGNFQFEKAVSNFLPGSCEIHTFDFDPSYAELVPHGKNIFYHAWGFKPSYEETKNSRDGKYGQVDPSLGEFKTFEETKRALGHEGRPIDIFKIDCEGCEWTTYKDWLKADIRQALVEVHRLPEVAIDFYVDLQKEGYVIYHKEPNIANTNGNCIEFGFLKLGKSFVEDRLQKIGAPRVVQRNYYSGATK